jgi:hypothetical protein
VQNRGIGKQLLQNAEQDARELGADGIAAWELGVPQWMPTSWFQKNGYLEVDRLQYDALVWKPFTDNAHPPRWLRPKKLPQPVPGQITVTAFVTHWCPELSSAYIAEKVANEMGIYVAFRLIDTTDPDVLQEWGIESALYIDSECIYAGLTDFPPPDYGAIKTKILEHFNKQVDYPCQGVM